MGDGVTIEAGNATITLNAPGEISLENLATTGDISVTSSQGSIVATFRDQSIEADNLTLNGATGDSNSIGTATTPLQTNVSTLTGQAGEGGLFVQEVDDITGLQLNAEGGTVGLTVGGAIFDRDAEVDVVATAARLQTEQGIGEIAAPLQVNLTTLAIQANDGPIAIEAEDGLTLGSVDGLTGINGAEQIQIGAAEDLTIQAAISTTDNGNLSLEAGRQIQVTPGASITTTDGNISLRANQGDVSTSGDFVGIEVDGGTIATTNGDILLQGRGGENGGGDGGDNHGIRLTNSRIDSPNAGIVTLEGVGNGGNGEAGIVWDDLTVAKTGGAYDFDGSVAGTNLTVTAGAYDLALSEGGTIANGVEFNNTGTVTLGDEATDGLTIAGGVTATEPSQVNLAGTLTTTNAPLHLATTVLTQDATVASNNGNIQFTGTIDSTADTPHNLTLEAGTGNIDLAGAVGNGQGVGNLTANSGGTTRLGETINTTQVTTDAAGSTQIDTPQINTTGDQIYGDEVILSQDTQLTGANLTFDQTIDGPHALQLNTPNNGIITLGGSIGNTIALSQLSTNSTNGDSTTQINSPSIQTTGNQIYDTNVIVATDTQLTSTTNGDITFTATIDAAPAGSSALTLNTSGIKTLGDQVTDRVGANQPLDSLTTDTGSTTVINTDQINTRGSQTYNDALVLNQATTLNADREGNGTGDILLNGGINSQNQHLTLIAADLLIGQPLQVGLGDVHLQTSTVDRTIGVGDNTTGEFQIDATELARLQSRGTVTIGDTNHQGIINLASATTPLDLTAVTYDLAILSQGTLNLNHTITTAQDQIYRAPTILTQGLSLIGNDLIFQNTLNSNGTPRHLRLNPTDIAGDLGSIVLGDEGRDSIGARSPLASLTTNTVGNTTLNTHQITTLGDQTYNNPVLVGTATILTGQNFNFNNTLDSGTLNVGTLDTETNPLQSLTLNANNGIIQFNAAVGATTPLASLTTNQAERTEVNTSTLRFQGDLVQFNGPVLLQTDVIFEELGPGNVVFGGTIDSATGTNASLTVNTASGATIFNGAVGNDSLGELSGDQGLGNLTTNASGTTQINGGSIITTASQAYNNPIQLQADAQLEAGGNIQTTTIDGSSGTGDGQNLTLVAAGTVTTGDINTGSTTPGGQGGTILIRANTNNQATPVTNLTTGGITTASPDGTGGNVTLRNTDRQVTDETIRSPGGTDNDNDIEVGFINAQGGAGTGGRVEVVTERFFRATQIFGVGEIQASISVASGQGTGSVLINHGGNGDTRFEVGLGDTDNGTVGAILGGDASANILVSNPASDEFRYTTFTPAPDRNGNIGLISVPNPTGERSRSLATTTALPSGTITEEYVLEENFDQITAVLASIEQQTGSKPAVIYIDAVEAALVAAQPGGSGPSNNPGDNPGGNLQVSMLTLKESEDKISATEMEETGTLEGEKSALTALDAPKSDGLGPANRENGDSPELFVRTATIENATLRRLEFASTELYDKISNLDFNYLPLAQRLYDWLIRPIEVDLAQQNAQNLLFVVRQPVELNLLPFAALHDGEQFLVEKGYSVGLTPEVSVTDSRYRSLENAQVLAMGASEFPVLPGQPEEFPLAAAEVEVRTIANDIWAGDAYLNQDFTVDRLRSARSGGTYDIVHLATHANFQTSDQDSYIRFYQESVPFKAAPLRDLNLSNPSVELLVLSACETAAGDEDTALGFAELAFEAEVKTVLASLWQVSDMGTLGLMTEFYTQLQQVFVDDEIPSFKAEALRRAQLAMLQGGVYQADDHLMISDREIELPDAIPNQDQEFSHPYFWAGFTMIGSPW